MIFTERAVVHAARNSGELVINRAPGTVAAVAYPEPPADDRTTIRVPE